MAVLVSLAADSSIAVLLAAVLAGVGLPAAAGPRGIRADSAASAAPSATAMPRCWATSRRIAGG